MEASADTEMEAVGEALYFFKSDLLTNILKRLSMMQEAIQEILNPKLTIKLNTRIAKQRFADF